jgi:hypothetical protein
MAPDPQQVHATHNPPPLPGGPPALPPRAGLPVFQPDPPSSVWPLVLKIVGVVAAIAIGIGIVFYNLNANGKRYAAGNRDEIFYSGNATEQDAADLTAQLKKEKYFSDRGYSVFLDKTAKGSVVSFVVQDGKWDDGESVAGFTSLGKGLTGAVSGRPLTIKLLSADKTEHKSISIAP